MRRRWPAEQITLKAGTRALRDIRSALDHRPALPSKKDWQDIQARLEMARAKLGPKVQELREADEWQRWANLQVQEELCRQMEALKDEQDAEAPARRMRGCRTAGRKWRWRRPPRAKPWRRFKAAQDEVFARTGAFSPHKRRSALPTWPRSALCERRRACRVHRLASTAVALQALQAEEDHRSRDTRA